MLKIMAFNHVIKSFWIARTKENAKVFLSTLSVYNSFGSTDKAFTTEFKEK